MGRIGDAWNTLLGRRDQVPATRGELDDIRAEWVEWEIRFNGILDKLGTQLARAAKRQARAVEKETSEGDAAPTPAALTKESVRRQLFLHRVGRVPLTNENGSEK